MEEFEISDSSILIQSKNSKGGPVMVNTGRFRKAVAAFAIAVGAITATPAGAVDPIPSEVSIHDMREFRGNWHILATMEFGGNEREVEFFLMVMDVGGQAGALIDSTQQAEPIPVEHIALTEAGADFSFEMQFGDNTFPMVIHARSEEERIVGTITDANGLFNLEFEGLETDDVVAGERPNPTSARMNVGTTKYKITFKDLPADGEDYTKLAELEDGEIFSFVGGRATKLFTDSDIKIGDTIIETENIAENYPGVYGLWLKKVGDGWHLVFNEEPDIWGTQHRAEADVAEVPLAHTTLAEPQEHFLIDLNKVDDQNATLRIAFGEHEWTADLELIPAEKEFAPATEE